MKGNDNKGTKCPVTPSASEDREQEDNKYRNDIGLPPTAGEEGCFESEFSCSSVYVGVSEWPRSGVSKCFLQGPNGKCFRLCGQNPG